MADIGPDLMMATTAERHRDAEQLRGVHAAGYTEAQGYLISRPSPATRSAAWVLGNEDAMPEAPLEQRPAG